jgi:hypothetical protein
MLVLSCVVPSIVYNPSLVVWLCTFGESSTPENLFGACHRYLERGEFRRAWTEQRIHHSSCLSKTSRNNINRSVTEGLHDARRTYTEDASGVGALRSASRAWARANHSARDEAGQSSLDLSRSSNLSAVSCFYHYPLHIIYMHHLPAMSD